MRSAIWAKIWVFPMVCFLASLAYGQQGGRGQINGTVADSSGAVISGAQVSIQDTLTGQTTTAATTADGNYSVPFLETGKYTVTASHSGFASVTQTNLILTADQIITVNFVLKPGASTTNVEVQASATQIDTSNGAISQVMDQKTITELPLNGRNPAALVALAPGAVDGTQVNGISLPGVGSGSPDETGASVNGSRAGGVIYQLDGITHMNNYFQTASPFPNPDATQEFRVITNNFDAQYGYTAGGIVSIATRSGTNQWHGVGFEFLRNNVLNAREYFTQVADPLKRNQFGGSVGGPIKKDKLFVFGNVQFTRERISASSSGFQVPNNQELAGDFSQICKSGFQNGICLDVDSNGNTINQIYKTWNNHTPANAYPNNQVNPATFSPFAVAFEQGLPRTDNPTGQINITGIPEQNNVYEYTTRIDYNISPNQVLSGRSFYDNYTRPTYSGQGQYLNAGRSALDQVLNVSISHIWTIRPNLVNDLNGGYSKNNSQALTGVQKVGGGNLTFASLGSNLTDESDFLGEVSTNGFSVSGIPVHQGRHNWIVNDTVSLTKGRHSLEAGMNFITQYGFEEATWQGDPLTWFYGDVTGDSDTDFLLGLVNFVYASGGEWNLYHSKNYAAFAQDAIKLTPSLTLNLGLRWEPQIAPTNFFNKIADYYPGQQSTRYPNAPVGLVYPGDAGVGQGGWTNQWDAVFPRISVAWAVQPTTTVRAAYGLMALPYTYSYYNPQSAAPPFSSKYLIQYNQVGTCTLNIADPFSCYAPTDFKDPFPPYAGPSITPGPDATILRPVSLQGIFTKGFAPAKENTWNLSIEHSFKNNYLFSVAYIGRQDYHLPVELQLSPGVFHCLTLGPNCTQADINENGTALLAPDFNQVEGFESIGPASYNAVQVSVQKQFSYGLQFSSNYAYSKNLDEATTGTNQIYNPFDPKTSYGISDANTPQIWNNTFIYQTPKLLSLGRVASGILGNWELAGAWQLHSGLPFVVFGGNNPLAVGGGDDNASYAGADKDHANLVPGMHFQVHQGSKSHWLTQYFNQAAFTYNAPGTFGTSGKNILSGPGWNQANLNFAKNFPFRERYNVQFRWEMFNAFNHTEFNTPNSDFNPAANSTFGHITSTNASGPPRAMEAGLRLSF